MDMKEFTDERKRVIAVILEMMVLCLGWVLWPRLGFASILAVVVFSGCAWVYYSNDPKTFQLEVKMSIFLAFAGGLIATWFAVHPIVAVLVALVLLALRYGRIEKK